MNLQCNRCGHRVQPIKEVELDSADWPAGRGCSKCLMGEMVYRPVNPKFFDLIETRINIIMDKL